MAQPDRQHQALQTIFSFFLGLMVLAFVAIGVSTFYPQPYAQYEKQMQAIDQKISAYYNKTTSSGELTGTAQVEVNRLERERQALQDKIDAAQGGWTINTSIILVIIATLVMGISLIRSEQLQVLSNGLLLGGLFTMIYGTGWSVASESSVIRFVVVLFALVITVALGYLKFVRLREKAPAGAVAASVPMDTMELELRVAALEGKLAATAAVLHGEREGGKPE